MDISLLNVDKNNKTIRTNHKIIENQYMKKDQNLPNKNIHSNNISGKPLPDYYSTSRQQSTYRYNYRGKSPDKEFYEISHKKDIADQTVRTINIETTIQD